MRGDFDFVESELRPGLSVIEASAGTGKTYAISHLVPRLLLDGTVDRLSEILLVTFTNDAARELADRVRGVLERLQFPARNDEAVSHPGVHRLRTRFANRDVSAIIGRALLDIDRLGVSTIHSFCLRTLEVEGPLCGLPVVPELIADPDDLMEQVLFDLWESRVAGSALASAVASAENWTLAEERRFLKFALPLRDAELIPAPRDFDEGLRELDDLAQQFDDDVCKRLEEVFASVSKWTIKAPPDREALVRTLRNAGSAAAPGFLSAARALAKSPEWINATGGGKAAKKSAEDSRAVALAIEATRILDRLRWDFRAETLPGIRDGISRQLAASREITYDGLIDALEGALRGDQARSLVARLRSQYKVALIDESQDTDPRQFEIFQRIFLGFDGEPKLDSHRLVLIGDPKQAIYAFRGADVNTYLAARELAGGNVFRLTKTYRAPEPLVRAVNALFAREQSLLKDRLEFARGSSGLVDDVQLTIEGIPSSARIEAWCVPDERGDDYSRADQRIARIAAIVASGIVRILNAKAMLVHSPPASRPLPVLPGDIAILVSTHDEAEAMSEALLARAVPAVRTGADDIMACEEAAELLVLLRAIHEPRRSSFRLAALATRLLGNTDAELRKIREDAEVGDEWLARFLLWQETWHRHGIAAAFAEVDRSTHVIRRMSVQERGERRVTNFRQLIDLLQTESQHLARRPAHLVRWLAQEIARATGRSEIEARQQQLESDADAVQIVTMHAAKGLEYPLVFCPFLWTSRSGTGVRKLALPGQRVMLVDTDLVADPGVLSAITRSALEDRLRLAYVAITRAKVKAWILCGEVCGTRNAASPLDWLLRADGTAYSDEWRRIAAQPGRGTRHREGWRALATDAIICGEPPEPTNEKWLDASSTSTESLTALPVPPIPRPWGMTSFSALTREKNPHDGGDSQTRSAPASATGNSFLQAPGGAVVGTAIHEWIERWDFSDPDRDAVERHFEAFPIRPAASFAQAALGMLRELRSARLPGLDCSIRDACPAAASSEWHFQLPIGETLSPRRLAAVFAEHGHSDYATMLAALPVDELAGYLHGFLDRIAFHEGAWGVIDWKTNNLGTSPANYDRAALEVCVRRSHYLLQAHLYLVALRRYLGPDSRIAGAWLVFLRGIRENTAEGILHIQPTPALLDALDALFARPTLPTS